MVYYVYWQKLLISDETTEGVKCSIHAGAFLRAVQWYTISASLNRLEK